MLNHSTYLTISAFLSSYCRSSFSLTKSLICTRVTTSTTKEAIWPRQNRKSTSCLVSLRYSTLRPSIARLKTTDAPIHTDFRVWLPASFCLKSTARISKTPWLRHKTIYHLSCTNKKSVLPPIPPFALCMIKTITSSRKIIIVISEYTRSPAECRLEILTNLV